MQSTREKILESIEPVVAASKHVSIVPAKVEEVAQLLMSEPVPAWNNDLQLLGTPEETAYYYFFLDSAQGCFWGMKGETRWEYQIDGEWRGGYYAFSRAVKDAFRRDQRLLDANYLATISERDFAAMFPGRNTLLLLKERHDVIKENYSILRDRFGGSVLKLLDAAEQDVDKLVALLLENFPTFRDQVQFEGKLVYFLKRAQIFPSDLHFSGVDHPLFTFKNLENLTIFADYKLPQLLEQLGVIEYDEELMSDIVEERLIPTSSRKELEIRANTIAACEQIVAAMRARGRTITTQEFDWLLWVKAQATKFTKPHHKTLTIFY